MADIPAETMDLKSLVALIRRQIRPILLVTFFLTGATALYLLQATRIYEAHALVIVDPTQKNILDGPDQSARSSTTENARVESELGILQSPKVLLTTIERAGLMQDPEFGPRLGLIDKARAALSLPPAPPRSASALVDETRAAFEKALSVKRRGLTYLLDVAVRSRSPEKAASLANTLARTYIELQLAAKVDQALGARDLLQAKLDDARKALAESEDRLDLYIAGNMDRIARETGDGTLDRLGRQVRDIDGRRLAREVAQQDADRALAERDWSRLVGTLNDQALASLERQRAELSARLGAASAGTPEAIDLGRELAAIEARLQADGARAVNGLRTEVAQLTTEGNSLRETLRQEVLSSALSSATLTEIYELQQEAEIAQRQYTSLLSRMRDLETQAVLQVADARIVSEALAPADPAYPKPLVFLALAALAGLGAGTALAFLREYYAGGVFAADQLAQILPVPVSASVPAAEARAGWLSIADAVREHPLSGYAEALRKLRATLELATNRKSGAKVIMVTSALPAEGKSTVALALARTYAASGKKVLLIDADLRKPSIHSALGIEPRIGFQEFLSAPEESTDEDDFYCVDPLSPLGVILGRGRSTVPTDRLLQSDTFLRLINHARNAVAVIVIDTSPIIPVVDARYIGAVADAAVLVVHHATTPQTAIRSGFEQLRAALADTVPVVAVVNGEAATATEFGGYYYAEATA